MIRRLSVSIQSPFRNRGKIVADEDEVEDTLWPPSRNTCRRSSSMVSNNSSSNSSGKESVNSTLTTPPSTPDGTLAVSRVTLDVDSIDFAAKHGFSHDQILEAMGNLKIISAGVKRVAEHLSAIVGQYAAWRKHNFVLQSLVPFDTGKCGRCELESMKEYVSRIGGETRIYQKIERIEERKSVGCYLSDEDISMVNIPKRWERKQREANVIAGGGFELSSPSADLESKTSIFNRKGKEKGKERAIEEQEPIESTPSPPPDFSTTPLCPGSLRRCNYCPIRCISMQPGTQSPTACTSQYCIAALVTNPTNDIHHLTFAHLTLKVTLNRIAKDGGLSNYKTMLKNSESFFFRRRPNLATFPYQFDKVRETVMYWLDFHRVQQDWGWLYPFAQPSNWSEVRELCEQAEMAYKQGWGSVLGEYSARLIHLGPMITLMDSRSAYDDEARLHYEVWLAVQELRRDIGCTVEREWMEREKEYEDPVPSLAGALAEKCANGLRQGTSIVSESVRNAFSRKKRRLSRETEIVVEDNA
ncbi:hypothetical protein BDD12DRAFT_823584 [Trichophaea hybrida]|nr:hypothetical protein BDD12DRAFT_823584 [Trichophaea hybrida]